MYKIIQKPSLIVFGLTTGVISLGVISTPVLAAFPDTQNHWARPFIEALAEREIIAGYPDGTFRPNQAVQRDEFAAIVRQAFDQTEKRQISSGSVYKDIPDGYWAEQAIEEAYQMGFMTGYPGGFFRPNQPLTRTEALVSLMRVLDAPASSPVAAATQTTSTATTAAPTTTTQTRTTQTTRQKATRRRMFIPMAFGALMQPLIAQRPAVAATPATTTPPSITVSQNYTDAKNIPQYAVDAVGQATNANIVVNYPNVKALNPNKTATRGDIAAFIHQTLVNQGRLQPLAENVEANKYIVEPSAESNENN
jgi:hypothetical protein